MTCEEIEELAGAYALGALPDDTLHQVEEHLADCAAHKDIADLRSLATALAWAAPEKEPPLALKARLMDAIRREATGSPEQPPSEEAGSWLSRWPTPAFRPYALAAVLAIAVAALTGWNVYLQTSDDGVQGGASVYTLANGGTAQGRVLYVQEERVAVITVQDLAPLVDDKTYQVWAISDDTATGIGLFNTAQGGEASTAIQFDLSGVEVVAITVEPAGGSPQPTTEPVLTAEI